MSSSPRTSPSSDRVCVFRFGADCLDPIRKGPTDDDRCSRCDGYHGRPRGLGDIIHNITKATGIRKLATAAGGGNCGGCERRRAVLNAMLPLTDT